MIKRVIGYCLSLASIAFIDCCYAAELKPEDQPQPNPHPEHFFLLHGSADPSLHVGFEILWGTTNRDCRKTLSILEGAYEDRTVLNPIETQYESDNFKVNVAVDGMLPGRCGWKFAGISYTGASPNHYGTRSLIQTNSPPLRPDQSPNGKIEFHCYQGWCQSAIKEDRKTSALGGILWWQPETTDVEVNFVLDTK